MLSVYISNAYDIQLYKDIKKNPITYGLISASFIILFLGYIKWKINRKHFNKLAAKIPLPENVTYYPIIGHAYLLKGGTKKMFETFTAIIKKFYGKIRAIWFWHRLYVIIINPEHFKIILTSPNCLCKDDVYDLVKNVAGNGLFTTNCIDKWKRNRKLIGPTFNKNIIDAHIEIFSEKSEVLCEVFSKYLGKGVFDCHAGIYNFNVDLIFESAMGVTLNNQTGDNTLVDAISRGMDFVMSTAPNILLHNDFIYSFTDMYKKNMECIKPLHEFVKKIIVKKKLEFEIQQREKALYPEAEIEDKSTARKSFIELLIENSASENAKFTDTELLDEVATFVVAGSDTSAIVTSFVCMMLGMFPEYQQRVYEEVIETIGLDRPVEKNDLPKLVYMEKFIKETMRLFPVGPFMFRKIDADINLGDSIIPKGAKACLAIFGVHRSEHIYRDPLKFDPERFSPEEVAKRHPYAYVPFSAGPRNCIGMKFAMSTMKVVIANIVRKFVLSTPFKNIEDVEVEQCLLIRSSKGFLISLEKRN